MNAHVNEEISAALNGFAFASSAFAPSSAGVSVCQMPTEDSGAEAEAAPTFPPDEDDDDPEVVYCKAHHIANCCVRHCMKDAQYA